MKKAQSKEELACAYFPGIQPRSAENRLRLWIKRNPELVRQLHAIGYNKNSKLLTIKEVELITYYLGDPS